ncbi:MAG: hypothetical protein HYS43_00830 [Candidatus Liptonbacteria bacterium]|nr:hypothetical protein [Candidatus Liptonbacteria bacterium]
MNTPTSNRKGQLIVEAMIALSVGATGILGILGLLSRSLSLNRVVSDNYQASLLAAEGVEIVKNILDTDQGGGGWNAWFPGPGWYTVDYTTNAATLAGNLISPSSVFDCASSGVSVKFDGTTGIYGYQNGEPTRFKRCVRIIEFPNERFQVNAVAAWSTRGGGEFSVNAEDHFYRWRQ